MQGGEEREYEYDDYEDMLETRDMLKEHIQESTATFERNLKELEKRKQNAEDLHKQIQALIGDAVQSLQKTSEECVVVTAQYNKVEGEIRAHRHSLATKDTEILGKKTELDELNRQIANAQEAKSLLEKELEENRKTMKSELESARVKVSAVYEHINQAEEEQANILNETEILIKEKQAVQDAILAEQAKLEALKIEVQKQEALLEQAKKKVSQETDRAMQLKANSEDQEKTRREEEKKLMQELDTLRQEKADIEASMNQINQEKQAIGTEMAKLLKTMGDKEKKVRNDAQKAVKIKRNK